MHDYGKISQGQNEFTDRDPIVLNLHYGQIDRWVSSGKKADDMKVLNSENSDTIQIGEKVMISETLFMKWLKLTTLIDRSNDKKIEHHVKRSIKSIAFRLGYSDRKGFYKLLKPLYEVGLIELKETKVNETNMIDLIVYPYPVYASSNICFLVKCREWEKRNSFGFALSAKGIKAKKDNGVEYKSTQRPVNKSTQRPVNKSTQRPVNKSTQHPVNKSTQGVEYKSTHTNDLNPSNDSNISNDSNHLIESKLHHVVKSSLDLFLSKEKVTDDEKLMMIDKLIGFEFKSFNYDSHQKYFLKLLHSIRTMKTAKGQSQKPVVKMDKLPDWADKSKSQDQPSMDDPQIQALKNDLAEKIKKLNISRKSS